MEEEKKESVEEEKDIAPKSDWSAAIERAEAAAERMEKANQESLRILEQQQELHARKLLGGRSEAGESNEQKKEETPAEYRARIEKEMREGKI